MTQQDKTTPKTPYGENVDRLLRIASERELTRNEEILLEAGTAAHEGYLQALSDLAEYKQAVERLIEAAERLDTRAFAAVGMPLPHDFLEAIEAVRQTTGEQA